MSLKFIVDENLPQHLTYWIREQGHNATHVDFEGLKRSPDHDIWQWAAANNAVVISKDQDFLNRVQALSGPRLIWVRSGNTRKNPLMQLFKAFWPSIIDALENGELLVELRG